MWKVPDLITYKQCISILTNYLTDFGATCNLFFASSSACVDLAAEVFAELDSVVAITSLLKLGVRKRLHTPNLLQKRDKK